MRLVLKELQVKDIEMLKDFFVSVFTIEPWNDDWSDAEQLHAYILDLTGNRNSLTLGLYEDDVMVGLAMGEIKHWYEGTEYFINELCIKTQEQGKGLGTRFVELILHHIKEQGMKNIFLFTERDMPAYKFYKKNGFTEMESNVGFYKNC